MAISSTLYTTRGLPMQIFICIVYCIFFIILYIFITGTVDKENWEGCRGQRFCIIYSSVFTYLCGLFYYAQDSDA